MVTSVTKGGTQKLPQQFLRLEETYWHDHSLENSWGALYDDSISFFDSTIWGMRFAEFLSQRKPQSLMS
jgi:hypothetical protein